MQNGLKEIVNEKGYKLLKKNKDIVKQLIPIKKISLIKLLMSPIGIPLLENNSLKISELINKPINAVEKILKSYD